MSVEQKIRELMLGKVSTPSKINEASDDDEREDQDDEGQEDEVQASVTQRGRGPRRGDVETQAGVQKDQSIPAADPGEIDGPDPQGSSADAEYEEVGEEDDAEYDNRGARASGSTPNSPRPMGYGAGAARNYTSVADPTSVVNMPNSQGNITTEEIDFGAELDSILGESVSQEFRTKAASLFEAAVIARTNNELNKVIESLEENTQVQIQETVDSLVEKVDSYLSYVVEQWMEDNKLAVDAGLRTEIAEDFIYGLKNLFSEHYIDIPEEKYDVVAETKAFAQGLEEKLNEVIQDNIELKAQCISLKKAQVLEQGSKGLAATEVEKLQKLVEGVDFENEEAYAEKVALIRKTHFGKGKKSSADQLTEDFTSPPLFDQNDPMSQYVDAISRAVKFK
jgi:hypothetical protein